MNQISRETSLGTGPKWQERLRRYFASGWAFLIPYLAAYLLYAWLKWPVNPAVGGEGLVPPLLHVYWFLHGLHLILGSVALRVWWRDPAHRLPSSPSASSGQASSDPSTFALRPSTSQPPFSVLQNAIPWLCLALLFYLPGVYMEFPADPWQHYARVNEWSWLQTVTEHSFWKKSSYFLAYSLIGQITPPVLQLKWFDLFYTGCCLLLCWQYYRLARALSLGPQVAIAFVLLQALLFGNFLFGFYRLYGMSSSVFAQLGAVALVRVALGAVKSSPISVYSFFSLPSAVHRLPLSAPPTTVYRLLLPVALLLALTTFNHIQGLGIAGLGVAAVIVWRLIQWRRSTGWWLGSAAVLLSVAVVHWWPRHPLLDAVYRPSGWLNAWYGFNLLVPSSPAYARATAIIGLFGLFNLVAGLVLLRRNHVAGWLTVVPVVALCLPCFAIPFANSLAVRQVTTGDDIVVFSRMLFAIPCGLALVALWAGRARKTADQSETPPTFPPSEPSTLQPSAFPLPPFASRLSPFPFRLSHFSLRLSPFAFRLPPFTLRLSPFVLLLSLFALVVVPASGRYYNRLFNFLMVPPDDLAMRHIIRSSTIESLALKPRFVDLAERPAQVFRERGGILTTPGIGYAMNATGATLIVGGRKVVSSPPSLLTAARLVNLGHVEPSLVADSPFPARASLFSALSQSAYLSNLWLPNDVALEHATQSELFAPRSASPALPRLPQIWLNWSGPRGSQRFPAKGARVSMESSGPEDRGRLDSGAGDQLIRAGDLLTLRPVMRTLDGNGWRMELKVRGPGFDSHHEVTGRPSPLGYETWIWIKGDHQIRLRQPGQYTVELTGRTFWPSQTYVVRYHFVVQPNQH